MKKIFIALFFIFSSIQVSAASPISKEDLVNWQKQISGACVKNFKAQSKDKNAVCGCIAGKFGSLAVEEATSFAAKGLLDYVYRFYNLELSTKEIDRDPFYLDEHILSIGQECLDTFK